MKNIILFLIIISSTLAQNSSTLKVQIKTEYGEIIAELYPDKAPITVKNFLEYVDSGYYSFGDFIRTVTDENQPNNKVKINVIQADAHQWFSSAFEPIAHETTSQSGIKHKNGVLSMARYTPGTATSSFFICIGDQPELDFEGKRNPDGQGFASFGKVVKGFDVLQKIHKSANSNQALIPPISIISIERIK